LKAQLSGDLDAIVAKALRKEPGWRYASPEELGNDLERYLQGLPVLARKGTLSYRLQKAVQRALYPSDTALRIDFRMAPNWGLLSCVLILGKWLVTPGHRYSLADYIFLTVCVIAGWSFREARRMASQPTSQFDRLASVVLTVTPLMLLLLIILSRISDVIPMKALAVFWNAAWGMAFLIVGLQANRTLTAIGLCLLTSVLGACLWPNALVRWLSAGLFVGFWLPGIVASVWKPQIPSIGSQLITLGSDGPLNRR
jgi:hypothetical protein